MISEVSCIYPVFQAPSQSINMPPVKLSGLLPQVHPLWDWILGLCTTLVPGLVYRLWSLLCSALVCLISLNPGGDFVSYCVGEHGVVLPSHSIPVSLPLASPSHLRRLWCGVWWHLCMLHWSLSSIFRGYQFLSIPVLEFHGKLKCGFSISCATTLSVRRLRSEGQGAILVVF